MPTPELSLIIPGKDTAEYASTLFATLRQQFADPRRLEVVYVDDGSTDGTAEVVAEHGAWLDHLQVVRHASPRGPSAARNAGMDRASAEVIAFLDGDDWLRPGHLEAINDAVRRLDVDVVRCDHLQVTGSKRDLRRAPMALRNRRLDPRLGILPVEHSTLVDYPFPPAGAFHRRLLDRGIARFPEDVFTAEDRVWTWGMHLEAESMAVVDAPGFCYRRGVSASLTQIVDERQLHFIPAFTQIIDRVRRDREAERFLPKAIRNWLAILSFRLEKLDGMPAELRHRLLRESRSLNASLPAEALLGVFRDLDPARQARLVPYLGPIAGWPGLIREASA